MSEFKSHAIEDIISREIFDSRGNPTIEVDVVLSDGSVGRFSAPSGASVGSNEAVEMRDGGARCNGKCVTRALEKVKEIRTLFCGMDAIRQDEIDKKLNDIDNYSNKENIGANTSVAISFAVAKAMSISNNVPFFHYLRNNEFIGLTDIYNNKTKLPCPMFNIINGGKHADNSLSIQEFMIVPNIDSGKNFIDCLKNSSEVIEKLKLNVLGGGMSTAVGDEGGIALDVSLSKEALDFIMLAITDAGYIPGKDFFIAMDAAASEFCNEDMVYSIDGKSLSSKDLVDYYIELINKYPIVSIEDPMSEHDVIGWDLITKELSGQIMLVGDDLFVTNDNIFNDLAIDKGLSNSILIKPNQIGTLSETVQVIKSAHDNNYKYIISHRSGETEDTSISHLAVASGAYYIKSGSLCRGERTAKYNELIRISELLS